jgi:hypothetical protein
MHSKPFLACAVAASAPTVLTDAVMAKLPPKSN